jgi:hypothetical protein
MQAGTDMAVAALMVVTNTWKNIFIATYEATLAENLSAKLNNVRFTLGQTVGVIKEEN